MEARRVDGLGLDLVRPARPNLFFYGTGNPGVWNPDLRPGDNKWSCDHLCARRRRPARRAGLTRSTAHDAWDYDEIMENILVDMD